MAACVRRLQRVKKYLFASSLLAFILAIPIDAVAQTRNETVVFDLAQPIPDPENFNWYTPGLKREHGAHQVMWEPLFLVDYNTGELKPWLAISLAPVDSAKPVEWVLTLRKGVTWSDGQAFTADDVAFTINELVLKYDDLVAQEAVAMRQQLAGPVTTSDNPKPLPGEQKTQVRFKLTKANPRFAREHFGGGFFGTFLIMPQHLWKDAVGIGKNPAEFKFSNPIGTGPYRLKSSSSDGMVWERNDGWWAAKTIPGGGKPLASLPVPKRLEWRVIGSDAESKAALERNDIDAGREMTLQAFRDAQTKNPKIVGWDPASPLAWNDPCARQIDVNTAREPWSDPLLRRAASLLIDRTAIAATVYGNTTVPSRTLFPEYGALTPVIDAVVAAKYGVAPRPDPAAAEALLVKAGWSRSGTFFQKDGRTLTVAVHVDAALRREVEAAREVARQLSAGGIQAEVKEVTRGELWGQVIPKGNYEMALSWLACGSVTEPYTSLTRYAAKAQPIGVRSPGFNNTARWQGDAANAYAAIVQKELGDKTLPPADVPPVVVKAYNYLSDEMPVIPLVQSPRIIPFNTTYWVGWPAKGGGTPPMYSWSAAHRLVRDLRMPN
jgi:peptide/nickel transport system substrate-binding protein